jgi:hypothetical protein
MTEQRSAVVSPLGWLLIVSACANAITAVCVGYLAVTISIGRMPVRGSVYVDGTVLVEGTRYGMPIAVKISQEPSDRVRVSIER